METFLKKAKDCMPLHGELFTDVIHKRTYGNISKLWHFPGHLMVTTNDGRKLFTFDCVPVAYQQAFDRKSLDIPSLPTPLVECIMLSDNIVALIDRHGSVRLWRFTEHCAWQAWGDLTLCQSNMTELVSVAFIPSARELVWCEELQPPTSFSSTSPSPLRYTIYRKQLPAGFTSDKLSNQSQSSVLIDNIPYCQLQPFATDRLIVSLGYDKNQVSVYLIFDFTKDTMTFYVGDESSTFEIRDGINFQDAAVTCLSSIAKVEPGRGDCGVQTDVQEGLAVALSSSGQLDIFSCSSELNKQRLSKQTLYLSKCEINPDAAGKAMWFLHKLILGIISGDALSIYSLKDGSKTCVACLDTPTPAMMVIPSRSPVFLAWILSADQLYGVQGQDTSMKELLTTPDKLPDDKLLQTDILRLARLQQRKLEGYSLELAVELQQLKQKWGEQGGMYQQSELAQALAPYMEEYWRLDDLSQALLDSDKQLVLKTSSGNSPEAMVAAVMETHTIGHSGQHAKLLWLSQVYPRQLLSFLCQGISLDTDCVDQNQLRQWQSLIGLDGGDLLHFEFVCRLLFVLDPAKLVNFVKCAEAVSEQAVGVSAFVRKKNCLIYYKAACECLPECQASREPKVAASSKAKLLLASECENAEERALKCYLKHGLWAEALELLREVDRKEKARGIRAETEQSSSWRRVKAKESVLLPTLLHVAISALTQNQVLSNYIDDLFDLMPNWKSLLSFSKVAAGQPEIRQQQLGTSACNVFAGQQGVPLETVRSYLLKLCSNGFDDK